ncbi:hypothetical protein UA08_07199 [Talaromyces atroroseus]|uniref:Uncharacterized protein n=1 Tax=Talaromyces atroroseus TaxID=1441469 RepID=A0A225ASS1_TALAT|nr:hypothetical protein UA08_07199 [Talaromyces atroroseus]OKL57475.1 hypothetical protein UA08_07199 [Talaromyces atroroseus]
MVQFNDPHAKVSPLYMFRGARNPPAETSKTFDGKTVLVTGCNTGVGYQAALKIAARNPQRLILGTRTIAKGEATRDKILAQVPTLDRARIDIFEIEYASFRSVCAFADAVKASTPTLDCVLLSAGVAMPAYETTTEKGVPGSWEMALKVNVLSAALLAIELLPLLKRTPGSILEFVGSCGYCNVTSQQLAPMLEPDTPAAAPAAGDLKVLEYFNRADRWTMESGYCEPKLLLMFVLQGLVESLGGSQGKLPGSSSGSTPILLACCPNQTKTDLGRHFSFGLRLSMKFFNAVVARTAEQGSRVLVSGLTLGEEANGRMWMNDRFDDLSPGLTAEEWERLQKRAWGEIVQVLTQYKPGLSI